MTKLLLKKTTLLCPERIIRSDLLIEESRISKIAENISAQDAKVLDCRGLLVLPGIIDEHVHFREPGSPESGTIASESRAAVLGGVTSFMDMPNNNPPAVSMEAIEHKRAIAARSSLANYAFYLGAAADNLEEIKAADPKIIAGIKIFMGSSTGSLLVEDQNILLKIFEAAPALICLHCEDSAIISRNYKRAAACYGEKIPAYLHPYIRSRDACIKSTALALALAEASGARIQILHISTAEEVELLKNYLYGNVKTRQISGEAALPQLYFSESDYARCGWLLKCNPAVKSERDRQALVKALEDGVLTTFGTDHAPHDPTCKQPPYSRCASGCASIQYTLPALCALWKRGELSLEQLARVSSQNVAERFRIRDRGKIQEGYYADLAIINPLKPFYVRKEDIQMHCGWSPFENCTFPCSVVHTIVSGKLVVENGKICAEPGMALPLEFER